MIFFACSRGECPCVRGSTHRKAHSNQHSLERRTLALDFAPLLKALHLATSPKLTPLFLSLLSFPPPPWNPTPLFLSLRCYSPTSMKSYAPVSVFALLSPSSMKSYAPVSVFALLSTLLHEILRPCFCLYAVIPPPPWNPTPLFLSLLCYPAPPWNPSPLFLSLLSFPPPPWNPTPLFLSLDG